MGKPWLVNGDPLYTLCDQNGICRLPKRSSALPIFRQFVGGETLDQTAAVAAKLAKYNVQVILDYGVEGKEGEANFDHARDEFIRVINYAATQENIPFMSVKVTGFRTVRPARETAQ